MNNSLERFRQVGSFIAGTLVGVSIVVLVLGLTGATPTYAQTFLVFGAPIILAFGITLQAVITAKTRGTTAAHRRSDLELLSDALAG